MALTDTQRGHFEQRLKDERTRAQQALDQAMGNGLGQTSEDAGDLSKTPFHMADLGTDTQREELDASNASRISRELAEIDAALERLYHSPDKFGVCERTGQDIPTERLDIIPWARTVMDS